MVIKKLTSSSAVIRIAIIVLSIATSSLNFSCNKRVSEDTQSHIEEDSLRIKIEILQDSVQKSWNEMMQDDDEKLGYLRRLLQEMSYSNFQPSTIEDLRLKVDELKAIRYDQQTMRSSARIDQYDSATYALTRQIFDIAYGYLDKHESELIEELINEVNQKNNYVLIYRVHYDDFAEELNNIIEENEQELKNMDINIEKLPLFKLPPEEI